MSDHRPIALSEAHVSRVSLVEDAPLYKPEWRMLEDADLDALADRLTRGRPRPVPIFAYGSLIWNPGFAVGSRRRATAVGWRRDFSITLDHFRGSPERPGLMLALASGGRCEGLVLEVEQGTEAEAMRAILRRELVAHELTANACWIKVETDRGREEALTFYADPVDTDTARLTVEEQALRLAHASGPAGSGAEYLLRTALGLEAHGIHDAYIWRLQELVAAEIEGWD